MTWSQGHFPPSWCAGRGCVVAFCLCTLHAEHKPSLLVSVCSSLWQNVTVPGVCLYWENFTSGEGRPLVWSINTWEKQEKNISGFCIAGTSLQLTAHLYISPSSGQLHGLGQSLSLLAASCSGFQPSCTDQLTVSLWDFKCSKMWVRLCPVVGGKLPSGTVESVEPRLLCQALSHPLAWVLFVRISLEAEKLEMDWPKFASRVGQRRDYAKQETLKNKIKILVWKVGFIIKITIK